MIFIQLIWYISLPPKSVSYQNHLKFAAKNCPTQLIQRIKVILTDVFIGRYSRFFRSSFDATFRKDAFYVPPYVLFT